jgi:predicted ATPase
MPQVERMVTSVARAKALPRDVVQQIVAKTDGVPLFVEELTKTVLESGLLREDADHYELTGPLPALAIPATLQDSLMARLDRLATVKTVAQLGATIGRQFAYDLLQAIAPLDEPTLQHGLRQLVEAELLYQRGILPQATYIFKHALIQDTAYQSLLKSTRLQYHRQIAQVLVDRFPETVETQPELVAHHYTEASLTEQAVPYWQRAGERATQHSAHAEAISHLTKGLALLQTLPDLAARTQQELTLHVALGAPLMATKGWAAPEAEHAFTRARELCRQLGETPQLFPVLAGLAAVYHVRGEHTIARELGEQMMRLAQSTQRPPFLLIAHYTLGEFLECLGELVPARRHLEQGIALYDPHKGRSSAFRGTQHPGVACLSVVAYVLWLLGYPAQALQRSHEALLLAQELSHPFSLGFALLWAARLHLCRREEHTAQARAEALMTLAAEQGFAAFLAQASVHRGWALAKQGQAEDGIQQIHQAMATLRATGAEWLRPYCLGLLAEAYGQAGQGEEGLTALAEALAAVDRTGERGYEAELYRLQGELLLRQAVPEVAQAEVCFQQALIIARCQQARSWELRAAMSLGQLWQQQGKRTEARELLTPIYGWFTEGFETADLQEAKALLDELDG